MSSTTRCLALPYNSSPYPLPAALPPPRGACPQLLRPHLLQLTRRERYFLFTSFSLLLPAPPPPLAPPPSSLLLLQLKTCPQLLAYSLEHRIKPRHRLLHGKGLKLGLHSMLSPTDLAFYQRYGGGLSRVATLQADKPAAEPPARL